MSVAMLDPVDQWSEVDEDYVDFPVMDDDTDVDEDEDLTAEEESIPEDTTPARLFWASYELWGRNLDAGTPWDRLAVEDFEGELSVEVEGLTAGASWEFRIRLIDSNGRYSPYSEPLQISLPVDFTPPPAPTAPFVAENMGYVTYGWTGELQGDIPEDMSHTVAYGRQMHPAGDPEGDPGDPFRLGRFTGEGYTSTGQLEHDVEHEIWLTAVDTTGNESPWSPQVSVTPSRPVDAEAFREELDEARDRLDQAEADYAQVRQDLDDGLADLNDVKLPALEAELADAQQAVTDAQTRLDAAEQAVADSQAGLDDLRDNRIPGLEQEIQDGLVGLDAELRDEITNAAGNRILRGVNSTPPEPENLTDGDRYEQWTSLQAGGRLVGTWRREDGIWREDVLDPQYVPLLAAGHITSGTFDGDRIAARAISTKHLRIQDNTNLWADSALFDSNADPNGGIFTPRVVGGDQTTHNQNSPNLPGTRAMSIRPRPGGDWEFLDPDAGWVEHQPGDKYRFMCITRLNGTGGLRTQAGAIGVEWRIGTDVQDVHYTRVMDWESDPDLVDGSMGSWRWMDHIIDDIPSSATSFRILVSGHSSPEADGVISWVQFGGIEIRRMNAARLIVDGSILARHIMAESVAAAVAEFLELHADQITAGTIDTARLNVSDLAAQIATVIELNADRITTGQLGADRISVQSLFADSAFLNELAAEVVNAIDITAETAFIRGELLVNGAVTAEKITVTEQLTAEIANFLEVNADHLAANAIDGMEITGATFRTATNLAGSTSPGGVIIDSDASRGNIRVYAAGGDQVAAIGGDENWFNGTLEARQGDQYVRITPDDSVMARPGILFHTTDQSYVQPQLFVTTSSEESYGAGSFVMTGREWDTNETGRSDLVLYDGGDFALRQNWGPNDNVGFYKQGEYLNMMGRILPDQGSTDMIVQGSIGDFTLDEHQATRGQHTFGEPSQSGTRRPILSAHVGNSAWGYDNWRTAQVSSAGLSSSGFRWILAAHPDNGGTVQCWVYYIAIWR
ncbi:hypothetical protein [Nesterenkonia sp. K-15-9-6]|uniref:hypothetical protein n=1 Tax=Nesterenkonia sp. K-15-9-6 TaxID=3093918 RepID=UPI00404493EE